MSARLHRKPGRSLAQLILGCCALLFGSGLPLAAAQAADDAPYAEQVAQLATAGFSEKERIVDALLEQRHPQTRALLAAFLDGRLVSRKSDGKVFITREAGDAVQLIDPVDGRTVGVAAPAALSKIGTNNRLRKKLKGAIALFDLNDANPRVRLAAVDEMLRELDDTTVRALRMRLEVEDSARVRRALEVGLALAELSSSDTDVRLAAVDTLQGELGAAVYNRLQALQREEPDARVRAAAAAALRNIEQWRRFYGGVETLFFGLSLGSVLVLAAIGLAITFGVMGVINMAHGELMMLGAYTAYVMQLLLPQHTAAAVLLAIPAAFLIAGLVGVGIERGVVRFLYGRPLETLLATFGLSLILQQLVRSIFSPLNRSVATPEFMSGSWQINEMFSLTWNRLYIVVFALLVFALLQLVLNKTSLGLKVRAVSQNRDMARALGVRSARIDAMTFGLGSGIAGIAGVALSQLTNVGPNLGQSYIVDSFMVVVFGGVGNLWGTLIGGMSLGVVNKLLEPWSGAVMAKILVLVFLILFIQRRPRGLFPHKGRAAEGH
ncbi:MAG: urea ABC transporter permease subunit UrtB [Pseudomonadota bacterium]